jgi:hypothetical protein
VGTHEVETDCAGVVSDPQSVAVVAVTQVETPTVVCAKNASPRDGMAVPLSGTARKQESERVTQAREAAKRDSQSFPTPEESTSSWRGVTRTGRGR